jgi:hypothetical protein
MNVKHRKETCFALIDGSLIDSLQLECKAISELNLNLNVVIIALHKYNQIRKMHFLTSRLPTCQFTFPIKINSINFEFRKFEI